MNDRALILANGEAPSKKTLQNFLKDTSLFVCADGGANTAARYGLNPDAIVGDLDSTLPQTIRKLRRSEVHQIVDDYSTDLEKALAWVITKGFRDVTVAGATGKRHDHFIGNLSAMVKFSPNATITFIDDEGEWSYVGRSSDPELPVGATISLIPVSRCEGIVTRGLRWNLNFESLELGVRDGTSNMVDGSPVHISVAKGNLILFHLFAGTASPTSHRGRKKRTRTRRTD